MKPRLLLGGLLQRSLHSCSGGIGTLLLCSCGRFKLEDLLRELAGCRLRLSQLLLGVCCPLPFGEQSLELRFSGALRLLLRGKRY